MASDKKKNKNKELDEILKLLQDEGPDYEKEDEEEEFTKGQAPTLITGDK